MIYGYNWSHVRLTKFQARVLQAAAKITARDLGDHRIAPIDLYDRSCVRMHSDLTHHLVWALEQTHVIANLIYGAPLHGQCLNYARYRGAVTLAASRIAAKIRKLELYKDL